MINLTLLVIIMAEEYDILLPLVPLVVVAVIAEVALITIIVIKEGSIRSGN